jgi:3-isopropylmalate dehydrogenase
MPTFNIVVFAGDYAGPEVKRDDYPASSKGLIYAHQVTAEAVKVLKVIEKNRADVKFNFQDHLLGGVRA